jgi:hypothetical protein
MVMLWLDFVLLAGITMVHGFWRVAEGADVRVIFGMRASLISKTAISLAPCDNVLELTLECFLPEVIEVWSDRRDIIIGWVIASRLADCPVWMRTAARSS